LTSGTASMATTPMSHRTSSNCTHSHQEPNMSAPGPASTAEEGMEKPSTCSSTARSRDYRVRYPLPNMLSDLSLLSATASSVDHPLLPQFVPLMLRMPSTSPMPVKCM
jgi:hypothetical protein